MTTSLPLVWRRSSQCGSVECVEVAWQRSRFCDAGQCVEAAPVDDHVLVRDSKDPDGPVLRFTQAEWSAFLAGATAGDFQFT